MAMSFAEEQRKVERERICAALKKSDGNVSRAAESLGMPRDWLRAKLRGPLADLASFAEKLRVKATGHAVGRPSSRLPSVRALKSALKKHGTVDALADAIGASRTTLYRTLRTALERAGK